MGKPGLFLPDLFSSKLISVTQTPLTVSPQLPLEIVMQLFKRMGLVL
jgi:hypothetical protein